MNCTSVKYRNGRILKHGSGFRSYYSTGRLVRYLGPWRASLALAQADQREFDANCERHGIQAALRLAAEQNGGNT